MSWNSKELRWRGARRPKVTPISFTIKAAFLLAGLYSCMATALIIWANELGAKKYGEAGHPVLDAALWISAPGVVLFLFVFLLSLPFGPFPEMGSVFFASICAVFSVVFYGALGLWVGVVLQRKKDQWTASRGVSSGAGGGRR